MSVSCKKSKRDSGWLSMEKDISLLFMMSKHNYTLITYFKAKFESCVNVSTL